MPIRRHTSRALPTAIILCLGFLNAEAERKIQKSDLPPAVIKAANLESRGAAVTGYSEDSEGGKMVYEVETMINGHSRDITISRDGTILEIEEEVSLDKLPANVHSALRQRAGRGTITKVESLTRKSKIVAYEAQIKLGSKHSEIQVDAEGRALRSEQ